MLLYARKGWLVLAKSSIDPSPMKNVNFLTNADLFLAMWQAPVKVGPRKIWFDGCGP